MNINFKRNLSGQMLIEIVVAVGIIALVLVGVSDLVTRSLKVLTYQKQKDEAGAILKKIQNDYRVQRDINPEGFYSSIVSTVIDPCVADSTFVCTITVDKTVDSVTIMAKAEWIDGGSSFSTSLVQSLERGAK